MTTAACTGMIYVVFQALLEHQTKAAESRRHKFMTECAVDGANHRAHVQRMRKLKRLWWDKLSKPEQTASSADLATGMLNSLAPTLQSLVCAATMDGECTFDRIIAAAKKAIEDTESKAAPEGPRRPLFAGSVEQPADPPNAWERSCIQGSWGDREPDAFTQDYAYDESHQTHDADAVRFASRGGRPVGNSGGRGAPFANRNPAATQYRQPPAQQFANPNVEYIKVACWCWCSVVLAVAEFDWGVPSWRRSRKAVRSARALAPRVPLARWGSWGRSLWASLISK